MGQSHGPACESKCGHDPGSLPIPDVSEGFSREANPIGSVRVYACVFMCVHLSAYTCICTRGCVSVCACVCVEGGVDGRNWSL